MSGRSFGLDVGADCVGCGTEGLERSGKCLEHDRGGPRTWVVVSADRSASPHYYEGMCTGDNRDADSIVALEAATGRKVWAFQVVHHNLWDYDVASEPLSVYLARQYTWRWR